jgi:hypothetical protein
LVDDSIQTILKGIEFEAVSVHVNLLKLERIDINAIVFHPTGLVTLLTPTGRRMFAKLR